MLVARKIQNLALIGFMGTGKSSVGRLVADALHFTFLDTDRVIEARAGKMIRQIFRRVRPRSGSGRGGQGGAMTCDCAGPTPATAKRDMGTTARRQASSISK